MRLPGMRYADGIGKVTQDRFGGLDRRLGAGDGKICDMMNMTSDHYPVLATRGLRLGVARLEDPRGLCAYGKLGWVDGSTFWYGGGPVGELPLQYVDRRFAAMGTRIIIFPDKYYYDYATGDFGSLESSWSGTELFFEDGENYGEAAAANTLRKEGVNWGDFFRVGDAVTISGCVLEAGNNKTAIIREIQGDKLRFYENTFSLASEERYAEPAQITLARTVPDLLHICENENRLWGCTRDTIYCSKLGDPFNWNVYDGLASDSWALTPGSSGVFTGCCSYAGYAVFFKKDWIHKIYGSDPSNFSASGTAGLGLLDGNSLAQVGGTLYYLGTRGVMAYSGGIPQLISEELGEERIMYGTAGSDGLKYYINLHFADKDSYELMVYDARKNLWHKEDEAGFRFSAVMDGDLYFLSGTGELWAARWHRTDFGEPFPEEEFVWLTEFGDFTDEDPDKKGLVRLQLRAQLDEAAVLEVLIQYDSDGIWHSLGEILGEEPKRSFVIPATPRRCDHYRLRLVGKGGCRVYSMAREYYVGSDFRSTDGRN